MNKTGTYVHEPGQGLVKVSPDGHIPNVSRLSAWMPKGDLPYYDKSAKRRFESRKEKRLWMKEHHLREGGIITNPDKRWDGHTRNSTKPSWESRRQAEWARQYVQSHGGTQGLLDRIQRGQGNFL